jgi:3-oxoacyl-[acyl-carrier protein] reductase
MDLGLSGKVAIVAASSRGLGRASALALAREGARVTICAREQEALERAAAEIHAQTQAEVLALPADLTSAESIRGVVAATVERFGAVDVLVTNSGGPPPGKFPDLADEDWQQAFELVTLGFVRFVREVEPHMRKRGWGRIIAIQSTSVKEPVEYLDLSNGIRPGIAGLMKAIMPDLARAGITINLVLPGIFLTRRINPALTDDGASIDETVRAQLAPIAASVPLGRLGEPIELGNVVAFLASEQASYVTGGVYQVDGGRTKSNV